MAKTILVGYDGSDSADRAVLHACTMATQLDAGVQLMFSARLDTPPYDFPMGSPGDPAGDLVRYGERILRAVTAKIGAVRVPFATEVMTGAPGEVLAKRAEAEEVLYVVIGRSGKGAVSRFLMGSVANRLAHICPKPLVIVP